MPTPPIPPGPPPPDPSIQGRLQRIIRAANTAALSNPRTAGTYTVPGGITDNGATLPATAVTAYTANTTSRGVWHVSNALLQASGGPKVGTIFTGNPAVTSSRSDFMFQGRYLTLRLNGGTSPFRFLVNGQYVATGNALNAFTTSATSGNVYVSFDFGSRIRIRFTLETMQNASFVGAYTETAGIIWPVDLSDGVHSVMLGDSYVQGANSNGLGNYGDGVAVQLGDYMGQYLVASGSGGTGWNQVAQASNYRFDQRIVNGDLASSYYAPDVIYLMASVNDVYSSPSAWVPATVQANALVGIQSARSQYPNVPIIVFGCVQIPLQSKATADFVTNENAVAAAVAQQQAAGDNLIQFAPVTTDTAGKWISGIGSTIILASAPSAATTLTLGTVWNNASGTYTIIDSGGVTHTGVFTSGSTSVTSVNPAMTGTVNASVYLSTNGNATALISQDWTHPSLEGANYLGQRYAMAAKAALRRIYAAYVGNPVVIS